MAQRNDSPARLNSVGLHGSLVDDNPDYLQATRLLLEREGHTCSPRRTGPSFGILPQQKVDLLLLDYFMPGMTGEQVVTEVRNSTPSCRSFCRPATRASNLRASFCAGSTSRATTTRPRGPSSSCSWTAVGLKAAFTIQLLSRADSGVEFILKDARFAFDAVA